MQASIESSHFTDAPRTSRTREACNLFLFPFLFPQEFPNHSATVHDALHKTSHSVTWLSQSLFLSRDYYLLLHGRSFSARLLLLLLIINPHPSRTSSRKTVSEGESVAVTDDGNNSQQQLANSDFHFAEHAVMKSK